MAKVGRLKLVHLSIDVQDIPELVTMSETPTFWEKDAREIDDPDEEFRKEMRRLVVLPPSETIRKLYNHPNCVGGIIRNFLTDLTQFNPGYRTFGVNALLRLARKGHPGTTLLGRCDRLIQRFTKLFRGHPTLGMTSLAAMERTGYLYEHYGDYERLYTGLRKAIKPLQLRNEIPESRIDINATEVITTALVHIIKHLRACGVEDLPVVLSAHDPELIVLAVHLLIQDERVLSPDDTLSDEAGADTVSLGRIWSLLTILTDHGFAVTDVRSLVQHSTMKVVLYVIAQYSTGALDQEQVRTLARHAREIKMDVPTEVVALLEHWSEAGRPDDFRAFLRQGGTSVSWQAHLSSQAEKRRLLEARRRERARIPRVQAAKPPKPQRSTGNKRRHRNFEPPKEKPQTDWDRLRNLVREIVLKHLPDHDADLVSAILLTLMRSGDRLMQPARWPQIKASKLRSRVRQLGRVQDRDINSALRQLESIRLVRQSGGKYQIATNSHSTHGALNVRTALTKLCANT